MLGSRSVSARTAPLLAHLDVAVAAALAAALLAVARDGAAQEAGVGVYVRTDTDQTTVITPRLRAERRSPKATRVDLVYTVDVWTSASIDIRTSASKPVTEQRDEIDLSVQQAFTDVTVSGGYRYSTEPTTSRTAARWASAAYDFADNNAQLAIAGRGYFDRSAAPATAASRARPTC